MNRKYLLGAALVAAMCVSTSAPAEDVGAPGMDVASSFALSADAFAPELSAVESVLSITGLERASAEALCSIAVSSPPANAISVAAVGKKVLTPVYYSHDLSTDTGADLVASVSGRSTGGSPTG